MTDSIEIVEEADGVQMDLLAEALGKGKVPPSPVRRQSTPISVRWRQTPLRGVAVMLDFPVLSVGVDAVGPEGLDRPSTGVRAAVEVRQGRKVRQGGKAVRCCPVAHTARSPFTNHSH